MSVDLKDPAWMQWYHYAHSSEYQSRSGNEFEAYISRLLEMNYPDFINPDPMGRSGDGGCDGLADSGKKAFACYGQRALSNQDTKTKDKLTHDFERAVECWDCFSEWTFITNASFGPKPAEQLILFQQQYGPESKRPITLRVLKSADQVWRELVYHLDPCKLNQLFPGVPHAQNVALSDLVELIDELESVAPDPNSQPDLKPVSDKKMDFNNLSDRTRIEINEGRIQAKRIEMWFEEQADPELRDSKADSFHEIYLRAKESSTEPSEIMEQIYISIGGSDYRLNNNRANAVYAIASYFFDTCDIFEPAPEKASQ